MGCDLLLCNSLIWHARHNKNKLSLDMIYFMQNWNEQKCRDSTDRLLVIWNKSNFAETLLRNTGNLLNFCLVCVKLEPSKRKRFIKTTMTWYCHYFHFQTSGLLWYSEQLYIKYVKQTELEQNVEICKYRHTRDFELHCVAVMETLAEFEIPHLCFEKIPYLLSPTSIYEQIFVSKIVIN